MKLVHVLQHEKQKSQIHDIEPDGFDWTSNKTPNLSWYQTLNPHPFTKREKRKKNWDCPLGFAQNHIGWRTQLHDQIEEHRFHDQIDCPFIKGIQLRWLICIGCLETNIRSTPWIWYDPNECFDN